MKNKLTTITFTQNEFDHLLYILENDVESDMLDYCNTSSSWKSSMNKKTRKLIEEIKLQTVWNSVTV